MAWSRSRQSRGQRLGSIVIRLIAAVGVAGGAALIFIRDAVGDDALAAEKGEQWGSPQEGLQTRLVPLADHFTLGQPMKFRLELKNVGRTVMSYNPQQVSINGSLSIHDPQGKEIRYAATSFQTLRGRLPVLTPGNVVYLFEELDMDSQYLILTPGKYRVQFSRRSIPDSNVVEIEVRPGELPPIKRIAVRLLDVMTKNWEITVHGFDGESDGSRPCYWDDPLPGWNAPRGLATIEVMGSRTKEGRVSAQLWLSDCKLEWTGKISYPGQSAPFLYGKCSEGYVYAYLPSKEEVANAKWPTFEKDFEKAMQAEREKPVVVVTDGGVKSDDDLRHFEGLAERDSLLLDDTEITDAGLKYLEGLPKLKDLWLRRVKITDRGLESLAKVPRLENLWLDGNSITDAGLEHLKGLVQLEGLSLEETKVTDAGLEKLKGLTKLQFLELGDTAITDAGMKTVKGFADLRSLDLDGTRITDAGLENIEGLTKIERLSLAKTRITDKGLKYLKGLTQLGSLDLDDCQATDEGVTRLQQGLPRCELYYKSKEGRHGW